MSQNRTIRIIKACAQPGREFKKDQIVRDLAEDDAARLVGMGNAAWANEPADEAVPVVEAALAAEAEVAAKRD